VGPDLIDVREKCKAGHFHPCVLFYVDEEKETELSRKAQAALAAPPLSPRQQEVTNNLLFSVLSLFL